MGQNINNNHLESMKYTTYFTTFLAYASLHILRMGYSAVKPSFQSTYQLDSLFLGLFDGLIYIFIGIGFFLRFLIQGNNKKTSVYLVFSILTAASFSVIPVMAFFLQDEQGIMRNEPFTIQYMIPGISLMLFGFCQFSSWPILLYLVNQHFEVAKEGTILGIWSSNSNVGNIIGFFIGQLILNNFKMKWQYVMMIGALLHLLMGIVVFLVLKDKNEQNKKQPLSQNLMIINEIQASAQIQTVTSVKSHTYKFKNFISYCRQVITSLENSLFLLAMALLKAILYGFLLWMPTYLTHQGYKQYSIYAPILFNLATILGSAVLGYFYKQKVRVPRDQYEAMSTAQKCMVMFNKIIKSYSLFYSCLFICVTLLLLLLQFDILSCFIYSFIIGFFLGGAFNMLASNEIMEITKGQPAKVDMLSTFSMATGNLMVGVVEIIIGLSLNVKKDVSQEGSLFLVLLGISGLVSMVILWRSTIIYRRRREESFKLQTQLDAEEASQAALS